MRVTRIIGRRCPVLVLFVIAVCGCGGIPRIDGTEAAGDGVISKCSPLAIKAVAMGRTHSCVLTTTGGVRCWGGNASGQLGEIAGNSMPPSLSDVLTGVQAISAGNDYTCALMMNGGVRCWGINSAGELGGSGRFPWTAQSSVEVLTGVQAIALGDRRTCALMTTGGIRCWGSPNGAEVPTADTNLPSAQAIAVGDRHVCMLTTTGGVRCWGQGDAGQLGYAPDGLGVESGPPATDLLGDVKAIAAGSKHSCALLTTGEVRCWGDRHAVSPIDSGYPSTLEELQPKAVLFDAQAITAGGDLSCALTTNGGVLCWGPNSVLPRTYLLGGAQSVATNGHHTCVLLTTGGVQCWGEDYYGQLGNSYGGYGQLGNSCGGLYLNQSNCDSAACTYTLPEGTCSSSPSPSKSSNRCNDFSFSESLCTSTGCFYRPPGGHCNGMIGCDSTLIWTDENKCTSTLGCTWDGTVQKCMGTPNSCLSLTTQSNCIRTSPCLWTSESVTCTGLASLCAVLTTEAACAADPHCNWSPSIPETCTGTFAPCNTHTTEAACQEDYACYWSPGT